MSRRKGVVSSVEEAKYSFGHSGCGRQSAEDLGSELEEMADSGVPLEPRRVVARARPAGSRIHPHFEWDDRLAGERWRIHTARRLIGALRIIDKKSGEKVRAFFSVKDLERKNARLYETRHSVMMSRSMRRRVARDLTKRLIRIAKDAESLGLHEGLPLWRSIIRAVRGVGVEEQQASVAKIRSLIRGRGRVAV